MSRRGVRRWSGLTAAAVVLLSAGPGSAAAAPIATASGSAVRLTLASVDSETGTYAVTHDGGAESAVGSNRPALTVLGGQSLITAGTLAQDAVTRVQDGQGYAAACAGLAGDGASLVAAGHGNCLAGGQNLVLSAGTLDLSGLQIVQSTVLQGLDAQLQAALQPVLAPLTAALSDGLRTALAQLGELGLFLDVGAIQSSCASTPRDATGAATLAGTTAYVQAAGQRVDLLAFPADPAPDTNVLTGLSDVAVLIEGALKSQLETAITGALGPLAAGIDQASVLNNVLANIGAQLAPLNDNVLTAVLNAQTRPSANQIVVTALDLEVLPAARQFGMEALHLQIGRSECGPAGQVVEAVAAPQPRQDKEPKAKPKPRPKVPVSIPAGVSSLPDEGGTPWGGLALGAILALATATGVLTYRRGARP